MNRFILIAKEAEKTYDQMQGADREQFMQKFRAWTKGLQEKNQFVDAEELPRKFKKISQGSGQVTDGPFPETKELLTSYFLINASGMEEAVEIAKACPVIRFDHLEVYDLGEAPHG